MHVLSGLQFVGANLCGSLMRTIFPRSDLRELKIDSVESSPLRPSTGRPIYSSDICFILRKKYQTLTMKYELDDSKEAPGKKRNFFQFCKASRVWSILPFKLMTTLQIALTRSLVAARRPNNALILSSCHLTFPVSSDREAPAI
jgi:hypothetical protein